MSPQAGRVEIRGGRLRWTDEDGAPAAPPPPPIMVLNGDSESRLSLIRSVVVLLIVCGYTLLNWPFQQFKIPPSGSGIPIGDVVLILSLATINIGTTFSRISTVLPLWPIIGWWFIGFSRMAFDTKTFGMWAMRDAVQVLESLYLLVGFAVVASPRGMDRFWRWTFGLIAIGTVYGMLYPIKPDIEALSPVIPSTTSGYPIPIIGSMVNSPYLIILGAFYLLLFRGNKVFGNLLAILLIGYMVAIYQQRTLYLILIATFGFMVLYRRQNIGNVAIFTYVAALMLAAIPLLNLQFQGRLGASFDASFLFDHFMAIFGISSDAHSQIGGAAEGVDMRIGWWLKIYNDMMADPAKLLFGLGYGIPLTDFGIATGAIVREPHNSYISITARVGVVGILIWVSMMLSLIVCWHRAFMRCRTIGWREGENRLMLLMIYFICIWVLAIGEDGFEKPFNIIPFYFFWGVVLRMAYMLKRGDIGPAPMYMDQDMAPQDPHDRYRSVRRKPLRHLY
jgi:hypothetical protein